jgi:hypothetical protein
MLLSLKLHEMATNDTQLMWGSQQSVACLVGLTEEEMMNLKILARIKTSLLSALAVLNQTRRLYVSKRNS